jgi:hypothetical protein
MSKGTNSAKGTNKKANTPAKNENANSANTPDANNTPAEGEGKGEGDKSVTNVGNTPAGEAPKVETPAATKQKARIPLKGVSRRGGGGGGGKSLGTVYNIAEVMYGHITTKTDKTTKEKDTAVMHHIINGEVTFVKEGDEVMIDFAPAGDKLYSFVANVNNKTDRKTSLYKEVEGDVPVLDAKGEPVLNEDGTPKTAKGMVPAPGCAWHGFIVASPANAKKVYENIKAMLTDPLTEGSVLRSQITLLEPPFNLHSGAAATFSIETAETEVEEEEETTEA